MRKRRDCASAIEKALAQGGLITIDVLERWTGIPKKDLRQSIRLLRRRGSVNMLVGDHGLFFYQLSQAKPIRERVARKLDINPDDLKKPLLRRQDRYHNQWCEFWIMLLKKAFPDVKIVREYDIGAEEIAQEALLIINGDDDLLPDFLAIFPAKDGFEGVTIAFEIERTRKSEKRLIRKLKTYLEETRIDGLVYICDSGRLSELIRTLYETKLLNQALRVSHYKEHFFLFSDSLSASMNPLESFYNVHGKDVSLITWCDRLRTTIREKRKESDF